MIKINPVTTNYIKFSSVKLKEEQQIKPIPEQNNSAIPLILGCLAVAGAAAVGLKKTSVMTYEEALKKQGIAIKNDIATRISTGERYTGKVQRYETRNRRETVEFVDGIISEKVYHNVAGRELDGYFYKDGAVCLRVSSHSGYKKKTFAYSEYKDGKSVSKGDVFGAEIKSVFDWAREMVKKGVK